MIDLLELHAYADGELEASEKELLDAQLAHDRAAQAELTSILFIKELLSTRCEPHSCSQEWRSCSERIRALQRTRRVELMTGRYAWALCAGLAVFIVVGGMTNRASSKGGVPGGEIARATANLVPVGAPKSRERTVVDQWLDDLLGQAKQSISPDRMQIVGAATGDLVGHRITRLTLRDANGDLALIAVSGLVRFNGFEDYPGDSKFITGKVQGNDCISWATATDTYVLIGSRSYPDLVTVAESRLIQR